MSNIENAATIPFDYVIPEDPCKGIVDVQKADNRDEIVSEKMKMISERLGAKKDE
ncbi:MAG: hypothetical protein SO267_02025 [Lachnospiraceae bacterium]|nr:hypothetical protein [Lachnospiraceae bacterium]